MNGTDSQRGKARGWPYIVTGALFAAGCAWVSYNDGLFVTRLAGNGEGHVVYVYPLLPDVLIVISLLALREATSASVPRSGWAVAGLRIGIVLTLAMNIYAGWEHSILAAIQDGAVPIVFFIAVEIVLWHVRHNRAPKPESASASASAGAFIKPKLPPLREVQDEYGCAQATAEKIRKALRIRDAQWAQAIHNREEYGNGRQGQQDGDPDRQRQGRQARQDSGRGQQPEEQVAHDRGRGNSNLTTGAGAAPATQRSRDGADHPVPRDAVPAVKAPAGPQHAPVPGAAGAQLQPVPQGPNGSAPRG